MYDELVKRLHEQAVYLPEKFSKNAELLDVLMKAADAIEALSAAVEGYESSTNMALVEKDGETVIEFKPKWISVTEWLLEKNGVYLAHAYGETLTMSLIHRHWLAFGDDYTRAVSHWMPLPEPPEEKP